MEDLAAIRTYDTSVATMRDVLAAWDGRDLTKRFASVDKITTDANIPLVYGLAAHTHLLGHAVADLLEQGHSLQAQPLVRLMYECSLRAQWSALTPDSPQALSNELARLQRALSSELEQAGSQILREGAGTLPYEHAEQLETAAAAAAKNFKTMCSELAVGSDAYIYYRLLSELAHPSIRMVDRWVKEDRSDERVSAVLRVEADQPASDMLSGFATYSLVWAGSAYDYLLAGHPRRQELEAFAERIGINAMLRLRPEVIQRRFAQQKAAKEERRRQGRRRNS